MIKSYLLIAWRSLCKNRVSSFINIAGLAMGMAVTILIGLWIWDEVSFDQYHANYRHIAQVMERETVNGNMHTSTAIALPMEAAMNKAYGADFKHIVMSSWNDLHILSLGDKHVSYSGVFIGSAAPELFSLQMVAGSRDGLKGPSSLLLSESVAKAIFGEADPIGKVVTLDNKVGFSVAGVYADLLPLNTTMHDVAFMAPWDFFASTRRTGHRARSGGRFWDDNSSSVVPAAMSRRRTMWIWPRHRSGSGISN